MVELEIKTGGEVEQAIAFEHLSGSKRFLRRKRWVSVESIKKELGKLPLQIADDLAFPKKKEWLASMKNAGEILEALK